MFLAIYTNIGRYICLADYIRAMRYISLASHWGL